MSENANAPGGNPGNGERATARPLNSKTPAGLATTASAKNCTSATLGQAEKGQGGCAAPLAPAEVDRLLAWAAHSGATLPDPAVVGIFNGPPDPRTGKASERLRVNVREGTDFSAPWRKMLWVYGQAGFGEAVSAYLPKRAALVERKNAERLAKGETLQADLTEEDLQTHAEQWLARILAMDVGEDEGRALLARLPSEWPEPQPIADRVEAQLYPFEALPDTIRAAVAEVRAFTQAPLALVVSAALAALSLVGQHLANVRRGPKLEGPCSLYLLTVNDSGERKSTVESLFIAPIREWEKEQARDIAPEMERYNGELAAWLAVKNGITERLKGLAKARKPTEEASNDLVAHNAAMPLPPRRPRLLYQDVTSEALAWCLASGWPCGGIVSSEAGTVFGGHAMGKEKITSTLAQLNNFWDAIPLHVDRRTSESFTVHAARVSLSLMAQESTFMEFLERAGALARGSGFLARFLLAWPASTQGTRFYQPPPDGTPALSAFTDRLGALLSYPLPLDEDERLSPPILPLSPSAHQAWIAFYNEVEAMLGDGGELRQVRDVASKTADNAVRVACLFHLFAHGPSGEISQDHFDRAAAIVAWHLSEAQRFFGELALPQELADAARLDRWLLDYAHRERAASIPTREAQRLGPVRHKTRLANALLVLDELGRARVIHEGRQKLIVLNPALMAEVAP